MVINSRIFSYYSEGNSLESLDQHMLSLFKQQYDAWPFMRSNYDGLQQVQIKHIACEGYDVTLQFNPCRITSTTAKTDTASISQRPCFLCEHHLPQDQKCIVLEQQLMILCNPFPIFSHHFTISSTKHTPQQIKPHITDLLSVAKLVSGTFSIFYNGPRCGASAPDHFHFQAGPTTTFPIHAIAHESKRRHPIISTPQCTVFSIHSIGRGCFVLEAREPEPLIDYFLRIMEIVASIEGTKEEPMINCICSHTHDQWRVILFPRTKHRSSHYFALDESKLLLSPAAVDMAGLLIVPREIDFQRITSVEINAIFAEVSPSTDVMNLICKELKQ